MKSENLYFFKVSADIKSMTHITFKTFAAFAVAGILLTGCSAKTAPVDTEWKATANPVAPAPVSAPPVVAPPPPPPVMEAPPAPAPPPPAVEPPPAAPAAQPAQDPQFKTCAEVKKNKLGPYRKGQAEYGWYQDKDNDGVVCE